MHVFSPAPIIIRSGSIPDNVLCAMNSAWSSKLGWWLAVIDACRTNRAVASSQVSRLRYSGASGLGSFDMANASFSVNSAELR